jgi:phosphoglycolate phosphatase-like HAD superfamily hydrolase
MEALDPKYHDPLLGVVFDLDGTLVLSHHAFDRMRREIVRLAEHYGVTPGHLSVTMTIPALMGLSLKELEHSGAPETTRMRFEAEAGHRIDEIEMEALPTTVIRDGAEKLLRGLTGRGYRIGILTRSSGAFARAALEKTGLTSYIRVLRSRSDTGPAKPDPEALLLVLRQLEVPPDRALFVGDHLMDAECATRARVRFHAVLPPTPGSLGTDVDRFKAAGAIAIAPDLEELSRQLGVAQPPSA